VCKIYRFNYLTKKAEVGNWKKMGTGRGEEADK